ncbi:MAG: master DNA invertase Mpi family serine-type recombinase [Alphaproteobacteria bacterium]|nr:master DNA invertase Mpi family serine-type recombinase [Alphaproteobacteria bacterium]
MIYGYIRTSTDKQNNENQRFEIEQFAENNSLRVDKWVQETISSRKNLDERKLGLLLKKIKQDDIIIASELSRLGRNLLQIMSILHHCMNIGCQVWTIKDNYKLGADIQSKVLAFAFGLSAEIERNLISQRTKRCLDRLRAEGKHIGRKKGSKNKLTKLTGKDGLIKTLLSQNIQKKQIAKILKVNYTTLYRFMKNEKLT